MSIYFLHKVKQLADFGGIGNAILRRAHDKLYTINAYSTPDTKYFFLFILRLFFVYAKNMAGIYHAVIYNAAIANVLNWHFFFVVISVMFEIPSWQDVCVCVYYALWMKHFSLHFKQNSPYFVLRFEDRKQIKRSFNFALNLLA